jgi:hypothetical protein
MDNNTKFYIFDRKELALIFAFMLFVSAIAFILGFKFGTSVSYERSGLTVQEQREVDLLSAKEEQVKELTARQATPVVKNEVHQKSEKLDFDDSEKKLKEEFEKLDQQQKPNDPQTSLLEEEKAEERVKVDDNAVVAPEFGKGKKTIRLASFRSLDDAKEFAEGFTARGIDTIISKKDIPQKGGVWYRVSIGSFDTIAQARSYIKSHQEIFAKQDFQISSFD